jgi:hypothetical protein
MVNKDRILQPSNRISIKAKRNNQNQKLLKTIERTSLIFIAEGWCPGSSRFPRSCWSFSAGVGNVNDTRRTRIGKYDFSAPNPRSKGDQETFRRGALVRAETPKYFHFRRGGERRRDYHEHPYWMGSGSEKSII